MMKQFSVALLCLLTAGLAGCGSEPEIPPSVRSAFEEKYPTAEKLDWNEKEGLYIVEYEINGDDLETKYSKTGGVWLETTQEIAREELPGSVQDVLNSEMYSGWDLREFYMAETPEQPRLYKILVKWDDKEEFHYYDPTGKLIKKS